MSLFDDPIYIISDTNHYTSPFVHYSVSRALEIDIILPFRMFIELIAMLCDKERVENWFYHQQRAVTELVIKI